MRFATSLVAVLLIGIPLDVPSAFAQSNGQSVDSVQHKSIASAIEAYWARWRMRNAGVLDMGHIGNNTGSNKPIPQRNRGNLKAIGNCDDATVAGNNTGSLPSAQYNNSKPKGNGLAGSTYWTPERMRNAKPLGPRGVKVRKKTDCIEKRKKQR